MLRAGEPGRACKRGRALQGRAGVSLSMLRAGEPGRACKRGRVLQGLVPVRTIDYF